MNESGFRICIGIYELNFIESFQAENGKLKIKFKESTDREELTKIEENQRIAASLHWINTKS
jgi:hypothetical protein